MEYGYDGLTYDGYDNPDDATEASEAKAEFAVSLAFFLEGVVLGAGILLFSML